MGLQGTQEDDDILISHILTVLEMEMMAMMAMRFERTRRAGPPSVDEGVVQSLFLYSSLFSSSEHCAAFLEPKHSNFVQVLRVVIGGIFFLWGQTLETEALIRKTKSCP